MELVKLRPVADTTRADTQEPDLQPVLDAMRRAQSEYGSPDYAARRAALDALLQAIRSHQEELCEALNRDFGCRSRTTSKFGDVLPAVEALKYNRKHMKRWMKPESRSVAMAYKPAKAFVLPQPKGVVGIISPWNYPFNLTVGPLAAAIAAGNRVMIKPSEFTPATSEFMAKLIGDLFDADYITVITGGPSVGQAFASLAFDHLLFTGATGVGRHVMRAAAENLVPLTLELGGKSPTIVAEDYSLAKAVSSILAGKVLNAGQTCIAPDYLMIPEGKSEEFVRLARSSVAEMYPMMAANEDYTSVINDRHYERLMSYIKDAREKGATVVELNPSAEDFDPASRKIPLTLVLNPNEEMTVMQEEIFGPILPVMTYDKVGDAIEYVNLHPRPLALYVYSEDAELLDKVLHETVSGGVAINEVMYQFVQDNLPFGGIGPSGMGAYHSSDGFETFSLKKPVFKQAKINGSSLLRPPYKWLAKKTIDFLIG